ncbi:hypothetical protein IT396_00275 [Candidatus Nomurabacteria bacterium]|nr:hypothetical protein [Candidatus Nomurabacteria bacterium]
MNLEELFIPLLMAGAIITAILMYAFRRYGRWLLLIILIGGTLVGTYLFFPQAGDWVTTILNNPWFWYVTVGLVAIIISYYIVRPMWGSVTRNGVITAVIAIALAGAAWVVWTQWNKIQFSAAQFTPAEFGALVFWGTFIAVAIIVLLHFAHYPRAAKTVMALAALVLIAYWLAPYAPCFSEACVQARKIEAGKERIRQHIAAERRKEQMLREEQRARRVARSPACPGEKVAKAIVIPEDMWVQLPSRPGTCDFAISDIPKLEFVHNSSMIRVSADRGQINTSIPTHARAKPGVGTVVADYLLCPQGMGPSDGSWECRSYSPSVPYGLFNAIFGKH